VTEPGENHFGIVLTVTILFCEFKLAGLDVEDDAGLLVVMVLAVFGTSEIAADSFALENMVLVETTFLSAFAVVRLFAGCFGQNTVVSAMATHNTAAQDAVSRTFRLRFLVIGTVFNSVIS
jgi:hypothetical protein